jgi:WD40 repeat protein
MRVVHSSCYYLLPGKVSATNRHPTLDSKHTCMLPLAAVCLLRLSHGAEWPATALVSMLIPVCSDDECVSASSDGSCIIWDLTACRRRQSLFANTFFLSVVYHPDESQIVTAGTDRKVCAYNLPRPA